MVKALSKPTRWLCTREIQKSIKESSHKLLSMQIDSLGLSKFFDVSQTAIKGKNGSEFLFAGLQDHTADSLKSYEGLDGAWVEEAHAVTEESANKLIPTVRAAGSEVIWSYNPENEDDYVHKLAESGRDDVLVVDINYYDNPWFPDVLEQERRQMLAINTDLHDHIWLGKCRTVAGLIFKRHWFKRFRLGEQPSRLNLYLSADYAGAPDPDDPHADPDWTESGVWGVDEHGALWAVDWWSGQEAPYVWISAILAQCARHKPLVWLEEKGSILRAVDHSITKAMQESGTYARRESLASAGRKADRAHGFAARAQAGMVYIPEGEWGDRLINQLCAFSGQDGRRDDMVDVCSLLARGLDQMTNARPEPVRARPEAPRFGTEAWMNAREIAEQRERDARKTLYR